ncbi:transcriptional repressor [soil metagenome]
MAVTAEPLPFRQTPQRTAVLQAVRHADDHPTALEIYRRVRAVRSGIGFATVYRALNLLVEHGEILELQVGEDTAARYDGNVASHDHIRCTACGAIGDVHLDLEPAASRRVAAATGYAVDGYELTFLGRCPGCA